MDLWYVYFYWIFNHTHLWGKLANLVPDIVTKFSTLEWISGLVFIFFMIMGTSIYPKLYGSLNEHWWYSVQWVSVIRNKFWYPSMLMVMVAFQRFGISSLSLNSIHESWNVIFLFSHFVLCGFNMPVLLVNFIY